MASMGIEMSQFENFTASSLYCDKCKATMPVRERLLLVLPDKELYDYLCTGCASSVGSREVTAGEKMMGQTIAGQQARRERRGSSSLPSKQECGSSLSELARAPCRRSGFFPIGASTSWSA